MNSFLLTARLDIVESLRARWFLVYSLVFGGIVALLFAFGLTESRVLGFIGLSRLLVTYIQLTMAILPVFVLITTVRSVAGDREAGVYEYLLSLPVGLAAWFWGKLLGRYLVIFLPVVAAMLALRENNEPITIANVLGFMGRPNAGGSWRRVRELWDECLTTLNQLPTLTTYHAYLTALPQKPVFLANF
jgi:hypothetical protein